MVARNLDVRSHHARAPRGTRPPAVRAARQTHPFIAGAVAPLRPDVPRRVGDGQQDVRKPADARADGRVRLPTPGQPPSTMPPRQIRGARRVRRRRARARGGGGATGGAGERDLGSRGGAKGAGGGRARRFALRVHSRQGAKEPRPRPAGTGQGRRRGYRRRGAPTKARGRVHRGRCVRDGRRRRGDAGPAFGPAFGRRDRAVGVGGRVAPSVRRRRPRRWNHRRFPRARRRRRWWGRG
mmetsp:Transcript_8196/g.32308  ORF Transcript_8196/g.32308 Transcript_8196/m.32308 type:complete len:239 (+) Transcript_8196:591-1307(+)